MMTGDEYESLKADIAANGQREPIYTCDGQIIDGRNRYRACSELGIAPVMREWNGAGSLVAFVVSLNLHRRHLTPSQRAAVGVDMLPMLEEEAKRRQREHGGTAPGKSKSLPEFFPEVIEPESREQAAALVGTNAHYVSDAKRLKADAPELFEQVKAGGMTIAQAKQSVARLHVPEPAITPDYPGQAYKCIVIDPPWPMAKIEREVRPNQGASLDYPTMTLEEIRAIPVGDIAAPACHLYLWVTQKFMPEGIDLVRAWGFDYQCMMTWVKPSGITPFSWMYNTEHVIYAHRGGLRLERLGLKLSFDAPANGHSVKPDVFYDRVIQASPSPRLDMFARKRRDGFDSWGNEVGK